MEGRNRRAGIRTMLVGVAALTVLLALLQPARATSGTGWADFYTVTDMSGNDLPGPSISMDVNGIGLSYIGDNLVSLGGPTGMDLFFINGDLSCIPSMADAGGEGMGLYPFNKYVIDPVCWVGHVPFNFVDEDMPLKVIAETPWTDGGGTTWVFDHWVLDNTKTECAEGTTSSVCSFTTTADTSYAFHAFYHEAQGYDFSGFFAPVDNTDVNGDLVLNKLKAGSAVAVKFSLGGDQGLDIFEAGYPKSQDILCDSDATVDGIEQTVNAGGSSLSYDAATDTYTYVWKTDKNNWGKTCRQLVVKLDDGTFHRANFQFTK
jgi:hypothetical protein